jgi:hypothetical protein
LTSGPNTFEVFKMSLQFTFIPDTPTNSTDIYEARGTTIQTGRSASSQVT